MTRYAKWIDAAGKHHRLDYYNLPVMLLGSHNAGCLHNGLFGLEWQQEWLLFCDFMADAAEISGRIRESDGASNCGKMIAVEAADVELQHSSR